MRVESTSVSYAALHLSRTYKIQRVTTQAIGKAQYTVKML